MKCPYCGNEQTKVRQTGKADQVFRVRVCQTCSCEFSTMEIVDEADLAERVEKRKAAGL